MGAAARVNCFCASKGHEVMEPIIPDQQALRLVVRQDLSDAEKYSLAQADTLMRLIKADSIEEAERMLSDASIQHLVHLIKHLRSPSDPASSLPPRRSDCRPQCHRLD